MQKTKVLIDIGLFCRSRSEYSRLQDVFPARLPQLESFYNPADKSAEEGEMKRPKRKMSPGVSRARRPKTGTNRGMLILLNEEEKMNIEKAAAKEGVSMSRFIVERALHAAKRVLSQTA